MGRKSKRPIEFTLIWKQHVSVFVPSMYGLDFRKAALRVYNYFISMRKAAEALGISVSSIHRWSKDVSERTRVRKPTKITDAMVACVLCFLSEATRFSSQEVINHVDSVFNVRISRGLLA
jgi:transposase-like protein